MRRLLAIAAVVAASSGIGVPAASAQECPPIVCDAIHGCYDTGEVRFCI